MYKFKLSLVLILNLVGCGTHSSFYSHTKYDELYQSNQCGTIISLITPTNDLTGEPTAVYVNVKNDASLRVQSHHYWMTGGNQSDNIERILIRVDTNKIIELSDLIKTDDYFTSKSHNGLIEQFVNGSNMVIRLNYYNGKSYTMKSDITDFRNSWSKMKVECQST